MIIREANLDDKQVWDSFVDKYNGNFNYYFDCRYIDVEEGINQLIIETDTNQWVGICCFYKLKKRLYSLLRINGFLFRTDITDGEKYTATRNILDYIEENHSSQCSTFFIQEENALDSELIKPNPALIDHGFRFRNYAQQGFPCEHILPLKAPFRENIWMGTWSQKLRQDLTKVAKSGVKIIQDQELKYLDIYIDMYKANYKRHKKQPPDRNRIINECNIFKNKIKFFIACTNEEPVVILKCEYTRSTCYLSAIGSFTKGTSDANKLCYKAAIEDACNAGYQFADFGYSYTEGLAKLKDRFKFQRIPIKMYEKRYSFARVFLELTPGLINSCLRNPEHIKENGKVILDRILRW